MSFYNTTSETGQPLVKRIRRADSQTAIIQLFFEEHPKAMYSPSQVWIILFNKKPPITSVRRSMTDLTTEMVLEKTDQKQTGHYGDPEHLWRLRPKHSKATQQEFSF